MNETVALSGRLAAMSCFFGGVAEGRPLAGVSCKEQETYLPFQRKKAAHLLLFPRLLSET
jgi:hypothetical protein